MRFRRNDRCPRCRMHAGFCFCEHIPRIDLRTRVLLMVHRTEVRKPSATGPLALEVLANSEMRVHGFPDAPITAQALFVPDRRVLLVFPKPDAAVLSPAFLSADPRPLTLVFPDGNWGQAARMARRIPGLAQAETAVLPQGSPSNWGLRKQSRSDGLSTFEAIARAVGIAESRSAQAQMESLFALMVQRTQQGWLR